MRIYIDFFGNLETRKKYLSLKKELESYQRNSVKLMLDGKESLPDEIASACLVSEDGSYMRDYIGDDTGSVVELWFNKIKEN